MSGNLAKVLNEIEKRRQQFCSKKYLAENHFSPDAVQLDLREG